MTDLASLLERFRRGPDLLAAVMTGAAGSDLLDFVPVPGEWSIRQVVCHIADAELVAGVRFRLVLAEDNPVLTAFDGEAWAANLDYKRRKVSPVIESFRRLRTENHELLKDLPPEVFERKGHHTERGPVTLYDMLLDITEHAENHASQIQDLRRQHKEWKAQG